jgi:antitoxin PrlF
MLGGMHGGGEGKVRDWKAQLHFFCFSVKLQSMKTTLAITERGVITLPTKLRKVLGISAADQLIAETTPEGILLRPAVTLPIELYSDERLREFENAEAELAVVLNKKTKSQ